MSKVTEDGAVPGVVGQRVVAADYHAKYWACKYHGNGKDCVIIASVICPRSACVWRCVVARSDVFAIEGADE